MILLEEEEKRESQICFNEMKIRNVGHHLFKNYMRSTDQSSFKLFGIPVKNVINYLFAKLLNTDPL